MHINIFIDESKHFETGLLIFGGFLSEHTKNYLDTWVRNESKKFWHPQNHEMKSSERDFWRHYLEDGFLRNHQKEVQSIFGILASHTYTRDNYNEYMSWLCRVIEELRKWWALEWYSDLHVYLDRIKLLSDTKILERTLKKDLREWENRISRITFLGSSLSESIQLADLITGYYKNSFRGFGIQDFSQAFRDISQCTNIKKS